MWDISGYYCTRFTTCSFETICNSSFDSIASTSPYSSNNAPMKLLKYQIVNIICLQHNPLSCPPDVHCCNNKYKIKEVLYLRYNRRNSSAKDICNTYVKKIFISVLLSLAIFHFPKCWGRGQESEFYGSMRPNIALLKIRC
jgi:hypothetical protein